MHLAINAFFWNKINSGSGQYIRYLVQHLNRYVSDLDITLIVPMLPTDPQPAEVPPSVKVKQVELRPGHVGKVIFEQIHFPRLCREVGADIAHVPYFGAPLRSPVPLVVTIHDLITLIYPQYHATLGSKLYNALVSASAKGANHILADSNASKNDIINRLEIPSQDITTVYLAPGPGYSPEGEFLIDMAVQQKYNLPDFYTLYLGGYTFHKNVHTMLLAFTYVKKGLGEDHKLVLAGQPPQKGSSGIDYVQYIKDLGLEDSVVWTGFVEEADKPVIYREALNFAFPSRYEGFGLPPLEAMASGIPVVAADSPGVAEIVGDAAIAPDPDDERQMGGAMIATAHQESLRQDLIAKGTARVAEFSWEKTVGQTVGVYANVLGG